MLLFALFSGLVNLASQSVFMRVVSAVNGDYYLAFILTTLTFIVFSAVGNLMAARLRRWLPVFELAAGLYSLAGCIGIRHFHLLEHTVPDAGVAALLVVPAVLLGMHLPAYAGAVTRRISLTYGVYHLGAALGVLVLEGAVLPWVPLSVALGALGVAQVVLAFAVWWQMLRSNAALGAVRTETERRMDIRAAWPGFLMVFLASIASYLCVTWGLRAAYGLIYPARMLIGVYNGGTLLVIAAGALVAPMLAGRRLAAMSPVSGLGLSAGLLLYVGAATYLANYNIHVLEAYYVVQALLFGVPVFLSAIVYSRISASLAAGTSSERARATGALMATSALGNLVGGILSIGCGLYMFSVWPPLLGAILFSGLFLVLAYRENRIRLVTLSVWGGLAMVAAGAAWQVNFNPVKDYVQLRNGSSANVSHVQLVTHLGSVAGYLEMEKHEGQGADAHFQTMPLFFIDGHVSHPLQPEGETIFGLLAARAFDQPFHRSLVLGLGSGQSAFGVSMISDQTDVVEISPSVFDMLPRLEQFNQQVGIRPDVHLIRADGTDFLRTCAPGSYDLVANTVTYPVMFASYKMYTAEAVRDAHRCLAPGGVYQGFIAGTMRMNRRYWKDSLAPIYQSFKYVYVSTQPYLTYVASDRPLHIPASLNLTHVVKRGADLEYLSKDERILRSVACAGWMEPPQGVRPDATTPMTTLDDPVIERDNTEWSLNSLGPPAQLGLDMEVGHLFEPYLPYLQSEQCWNIDGVLREKPGAPAVIRPPLVPLLRGPAQH
ncbi:spermidine synthase [Paraburkholderia aspalathi]|nr:hypothetical protein [Paraburkholderia aspalathi]MBK3780364.1 spermidine synthase [Paraburkholderia aspalathi]